MKFTLLIGDRLPAHDVCQQIENIKWILHGIMHEVNATESDGLQYTLADSSLTPMRTLISRTGIEDFETFQVN